MKFKLGDKVRIVNGGRAYPYYVSWSERGFTLDKTMLGDCAKGKTGEVVEVGPHKDDNKTLAMIKLKETGTYVLMNVDGLEHVEKVPPGQIKSMTDFMESVARGNNTFWQVSKIRKPKKFDWNGKLQYTDGKWRFGHGPDYWTSFDSYNWETNANAIWYIFETEEQAQKFHGRCPCCGKKIED